MAEIEAVDLHREFRVRSGIRGRKKKTFSAVQGVSLQIAPGELFGVLGPNGAGKTTTIKMLITLLLPTSGSARIAGFDVVTHPHEVRRRIGYVFGGDRGLYQRLSAYDNLRYFAEIYGVEPRRQKARIGYLLELVGLAGREHERVEGYSRGMRQRLHIARGILHDPEIVILDEPTIGIDPVGSRELRATVRDLNAGGKTILLTTHYMQEADELCDRLAVIRAGRIVAQGRPGELKAGVAGAHVLEVALAEVGPAVVDRVRSIPGVRSAEIEQRPDAPYVITRIEPGADVIPPLVRALDGHRILRIDTRQATLEDAYVELVGSS